MTTFAIFDTAAGFLQAIVDADDAVTAARQAMADAGADTGQLFGSYSRREATGEQTYIEPVMIALDATGHDTSGWDADSGWPEDLFDAADTIYIYDRSTEHRVF